MRIRIGTRARSLPRITGRFELALIALLTLLVMSEARAQIAVTGTDVTATPGSTTDVAFNFDFGSGASFTSFAYELTFNSAALQLTGVSVDGQFSSLAAIESATGQFTPFASDATLSNGDPTDLLPPFYSPPPAGDLNSTGDGVASWFAAIDADGNYVPVNDSGETTITYVFDVLSDAVSSTVSAMIDSFTDGSGNPGTPVGASAAVTVTSAVAAPEISDDATVAVALSWLAGFVAVLRGRKKSKS